MAGWWLISYLALWGVVVFLCLLVIGSLRQIGLLQRHLGLHQSEPKAPQVKDTGPNIGSSLPELVAETINGFGTITSEALLRKGGLLLLFLSPMCEGCQKLVGPLNALAQEREQHEAVVVVLQADEQACQSFLDLFPLHVPVICDESQQIMGQFSLNVIPFGFMYDSQGTLIRKGLTTELDAVRAVLGEESVPQSVLSQVFPPRGQVGMKVSIEL